MRKSIVKLATISALALSMIGRGTSQKEELASDTDEYFWLH